MKRQLYELNQWFCVFCQLIYNITIKKGKLNKSWTALWFQRYTLVNWSAAKSAFQLLWAHEGAKAEDNAIKKCCLKNTKLVLNHGAMKIPRIGHKIKNSRISWIYYYP